MAKLTELYQWGHIEADAYRRRRKDIENQIKVLPVHRDEMDLRQTARWLERLPDLWDTAGADHQQRFAAELIARVDISRDGEMTAVQPKQRYASLVAAALVSVGPAGFEPATLGL